MFRACARGLWRGFGAGALVVLVLALLAGCGDTSTSSSPDTTDNTPTPTTTCGTSCGDIGTTQALYRTVWFLWNNNIAGTATGSKDITASCPLGGTAHITGTTAADSSTGINTAHVTYTFSACGNSGTFYDVTLNGSLSQDGTFISSPYFEAMTYSAGGLSFNGTARDARESLAQRKVAGVCDVSFSVQYYATSSTGTYAGALCGRSVNFTW